MTLTTPQPCKSIRAPGQIVFYPPHPPQHPTLCPAQRAFSRAWGQWLICLFYSTLTRVTTAPCHLFAKCHTDPPNWVGAPSGEKKQ